MNAVCQYLDLAAVEKQSLLDCESVAARYQRLLEILEFRALERDATAGPETHRPLDLATFRARSASNMREGQPWLRTGP